MIERIYIRVDGEKIPAYWLVEVKRNGETLFRKFADTIAEAIAEDKRLHELADSMLDCTREEFREAVTTA